MIRTILGAVALLVAMPAAAQEAPTTRFSITGVEIVLPIPKGFCLPVGDGITAAQLAAASDNDNVTDLTLNSCDAKRSLIDYYLLKTPKASMMMNIGRAELIEALLKEIDDPAGKATLDPGNINPKVEGELEKFFGEKASMAGRIVPLGHDDVCVYLGGVMSLSIRGQTIKRAISLCMTAVAGRAIFINRYADGSDPANVTRNLAAVKALALSMEGGPAH